MAAVVAAEAEDFSLVPERRYGKYLPAALVGPNFVLESSEHPCLDNARGGCDMGLGEHAGGDDSSNQRPNLGLEFGSKYGELDLGLDERAAASADDDDCELSVVALVVLLDFGRGMKEVCLEDILLDDDYLVYLG